MSYFEKTGIYAIDSPSIDAFGRWRVSDVITLFDSKNLIDSRSMFWSDTLFGNSTASYNPSGSEVLMYVGTTSGSRVVRQTKKYYNYQPGKSQLIVTTGYFGPPADGIIKRMGYFDDADGVFFEKSGSLVGVVRRSSVTGTPVDTFVSQSDWNQDRMDGTGPSGKRIDFNKAQICFFDMEWLGLGRLRYGTYISGSPYYVHNFYHANELEKVYMVSPNLPVRYEIVTRTNATTGSHMSQICSTVISEGANDIPISSLTSFDNANLGVSLNTNNYGVVIAVRRKPNKERVEIHPESFNMMTTTANANYKWSLLINPTLGGTNLSWQDGPAWSSLQFATGSTANASATTIINEGRKVLSGFVSNETSVEGIELGNLVHIGGTYSGVQDILVLAAQPLSSNTTLYGSIISVETI